ncbi:MAG: hydroxylamine oxidation protein HaoB [Burkholderiales bacterium]|nr:hydroxylamine oxidation protein HaoB [Burkholderiales bacterium]
MEAVLTRPANKLLPPLGFLLAAGGLLLLGWVAYSALNPEPAPYHYQLVEENRADWFGKLGIEAWPNLKIEKYEMRVDGIDQPVAIAHLARRADAAPVMIDWENRSEEPVASLDVRFAELAVVAKAIEKYTAKDALVLGWWDTSRQIRLLTGRETAFDAHLGEPFVSPLPWRARNGSIDRYEREFWGAPPNAEEQQSFERFADALSGDVATGVATLHGLVGGREAYIAVHVSDLYKLGLMRPDRLGVASRVFPSKGDMHARIGFVQRWMRDNNYTAYGLQELSEDQVRAYFLTDARSGNTLLAQMLPLTTSRRTELTALQLVYQHGNYWVYRLPTVNAPR